MTVCDRTSAVVRAATISQRCTSGGDGVRAPPEAITAASSRHRGTSAGYTPQPRTGGRQTRIHGLTDSLCHGFSVSRCHGFTAARGALGRRSGGAAGAALGVSLRAAGRLELTGHRLTSQQRPPRREPGTHSHLTAHSGLTRRTVDQHGALGLKQW